MEHAPINISLNSITIHSLSHSSHPSARLTSLPLAHEALAMAHLERTLALVRSAMTEVTPSLSFTTQVTQPSKEPAHIMGNEWYRALMSDGWYKLIEQYVIGPMISRSY
jgi:hypothetical protein